MAPGQSTRCNLVRMETPNEVWLREEGRTGPYYKMKQKMSEYFFYREEPVVAVLLSRHSIKAGPE